MREWPRQGGPTTHRDIEEQDDDWYTFEFPKLLKTADELLDKRNVLPKKAEL